MKRLFIAVNTQLSPEFHTFSQLLKRNMTNDSVVWVKDELQHLTLRFLGKTPDCKISEICEILHEVVNQNEPFELTLNKLGVFGSRYAPTTLWYGFSEFSKFEQLFNQLEGELLKSGFNKNNGNFVPHLTVGRIKKIDSKKKFWGFVETIQPTFSQIIPVNELLLMQSKLTLDGPHYITLKRFNF